MQISIREAREKLSHLLNAVEQGQEVEITRRGRVVARLTRPRNETEDGNIPAARAAEREALRNRLAPSQTSAAQLIRELRDERG